MVYAEYAGLINQKAGAGAQNAFGGAALVVNQKSAGQTTHSISAGTVLCPMTRRFARFVSLGSLMSCLSLVPTMNSAAPARTNVRHVLFAGT